MRHDPAAPAISPPSSSSSPPSLRLHDASPSADAAAAGGAAGGAAARSVTVNRGRFGRLFPPLHLRLKRHGCSSSPSTIWGVNLDLKSCSTKPKRGFPAAQVSREVWLPVFWVSKRGGVDRGEGGDYRLRSGCCCCCCRLFAGKVTDNKGVCAPVGVWTPPGVVGVVGGWWRGGGGVSDEKATDPKKKRMRGERARWQKDGE